MFYPTGVDICNCGVDMGVTLPQPELLDRQGIIHGSKAWRMQVFGAALYWHLATTPGPKANKVNLDMLRGRDVLEVSCMRGGGAHYLAHVAGPRTYVATDGVKEHVELCKKLHAPVPGLRYELADPQFLSRSYEDASFDFVLCVQAGSSLGDTGLFIESALKVLRPGGRIILCDAMPRPVFENIMLAVQRSGAAVDASTDISASVRAAHVCKLPTGYSYVRMIIRKVIESEHFPDREPSCE